MNDAMYSCIDSSEVRNVKVKQLLPGIGAALGMLILILDGRTALEGAQTGMELCIKTVIPSLFPFFVLSIWMTGSFAGRSLSFLRPLGRLCRIPNGAESILIAGFLGGYPTGAQCISEAYHAGCLEKQEAERMLAFCNNAGPAFLFGMVASMFSGKQYVWCLWAIHVFSAILVAQVIPQRGRDSFQMSVKPQITLSDALHSAVRVMAAVCGWVILFRLAITFLKRWMLWILPTPWQIMVVGFLELSNGCIELLSIENATVRFLICSCILAFGGICVSMQTVSVTRGLSLRFYFLGKILQTVFSLILSVAVVYGSWFSFFAILLPVLLFIRKMQNKSSIRAAVGV